ncbi:MAG: MFS transporter [Bryobacteraceae bacterium]|nr:MFS transporter [Bryobacteraceae bacterium]MDW8379290.1 MFS transporter [Bryobacterales bacterium]
MIRRIFKAFEYRDFRLMWLGACTSSIGTWMQKLAQSWLVLELSGSSRLLGLDSFLGEIPILLFSLVGGVIADRHDRRHLLLASQVTQMTCAFLLGALLGAGVVQVWHILTLSFVTGLAQAFGGPAYQALIPRLVKAEDLPNAIALNSIQFNLARIIGPMVGGLAMAKLGAAWCFTFNGASFIAVIVSLLLLHERYVPAESSKSVIDSMKDGLAFIRQRRAMRPLIALAFLMTFLGIPLVVFLPVFARDVFLQDANTYTLLLSVSGAGSVTGALTVAAFGHIRNKGKLTLATMGALGVLMLGFALSRTLILSCLLLFLGGAALIICFAMISSLVQLITSDEMRGRVMSVYNVAFRGGMPLGSLLSGELIHDFSAPPVIAANGALLTLLSLYFLCARKEVSEL